MKIISLIFFLFAGFFLVKAQPGMPDLTFGTNSRSIIDISNGSADGARSVLVQDDGKLVIAGWTSDGTSDFSCIRLNEDGSLDNTFAGDGKITIDFNGSNDDLYDAALQSDGKIILAGSTIDGSGMNFIFTRLNTDGTIDDDFGTNGQLNLDVLGNNEDEFCTSLAIQSDGKILGLGQTGLIGNTNIAMVRLNTDGSLDQNFGSAGIVEIMPGNMADRAGSIVLQQDGKILIGGGVSSPDGIEMYVFRFNADGSFDNSFSDDGKLTLDLSGYISFCNDLAVQPNGKILAGGYVKDAPGGDEDLALVRINSDGTLDNSYGVSGVIITDVLGDDRIESVEVQPDGRAVIAGYSEGSGFKDFLLARYTNNGFLNISYGTNGLVIDDLLSADDEAYDLAIDDDLRIVVAGRTDNLISGDYAVVRYQSGLNAGIEDLKAGISKVQIYPNPASQGSTKLSIESINNADLQIHILDLSGRIVNRSEYKLRKGTQEIILDTRTLTPGSYLIGLQIGNKSGSIPLIIR